MNYAYEYSVIYKKRRFLIFSMHCIGCQGIAVRLKEWPK